MRKVIRQKCLTLATSLGLLWATPILITPSAMAVNPVSINQDADVPWSSAIENPFDGKLVYDKHFSDNFAFVTSWSRQDIKATYTEYWSEVVAIAKSGEVGGCDITITVGDNIAITIAIMIPISMRVILSESQFMREDGDRNLQKHLCLP